MRVLIVCKIIAINVLVSLLVIGASAQYRNRAVKVTGSPNLKSEYITTGLFLITGEGSNSVVRLTGNGLIIVDDKLPGNYAGIVSRAQKISEQDVRFLFLTAVSKSNTGSLDQFAANHTVIVAQENAAKNLLAQGLVAAENEKYLLTFDRDRTIKLGGVEVQALYYGNAHSTGDSVVYFPYLKAVAVGELYSSNPSLGEGGSLVDWSSVLEQLLKLDFDTVIPAAGAPVTKADLTSFKSKMDTLINRASALVKQGVPKDQLLAALNSDDLGWNLNFTPEQLDHFYAELTRAEMSASGR